MSVLIKRAKVVKTIWDNKVGMWKVTYKFYGFKFYVYKLRPSVYPKGFSTTVLNIVFRIYKLKEF